MAANVTEIHKTFIECESITFTLKATVENDVIRGISINQNLDTSENLRPRGLDELTLRLRNLDELKEIRDLCQEAIEAIEERLAHEVSAV